MNICQPMGGQFTQCLKYHCPKCLDKNWRTPFWFVVSLSHYWQSIAMKSVQPQCLRMSRLIAYERMRPLESPVMKWNGPFRLTILSSGHFFYCQMSHRLSIFQNTANWVWVIGATVPFLSAQRLRCAKGRCYSDNLPFRIISNQWRPTLLFLSNQYPFSCRCRWNLIQKTLSPLLSKLQFELYLAALGICWFFSKQFCIKWRQRLPEISLETPNTVSNSQRKADR